MQPEPPGPSGPSAEPPPVPDPSANGEDTPPFVAFKQLVEIHAYNFQDPAVRAFYEQNAHDQDFKRRADTLRKVSESRKPRKGIRR